jgi:hypothetical protein
MMIAFEKAIQKAITRPFLSVDHTSFLWAFCQEFVRSTTQRFVAASGEGFPLSETTLSGMRGRWQPRGCFPMTL